MNNDSTKSSDESLFLAEMVDVTPLRPANKISARKIKIRRISKTTAVQTTNEDHYFIIDDALSCSEPVEDCPDILSFSRSGLQHNVLKKLRQGKQPIEQILDLHGLTVAQARNELLDFLEKCIAENVRHALIIHGKGFRSRDKPVIKPMVNRWLRAVDQVLAFHSAQPMDGGNGAVYVLLKTSSVCSRIE